MEQKSHYLFGMHSVTEAVESNKKIEKVDKLPIPELAFQDDEILDIELV